jgi:hypothetical protein
LTNSSSSLRSLKSASVTPTTTEIVEQGQHPGRHVPASGVRRLVIADISIHNANVFYGRHSAWHAASADFSAARERRRVPVRSRTDRYLAS